MGTPNFLVAPSHPIPRPVSCSTFSGGAEGSPDFHLLCFWFPHGLKGIYHYWRYMVLVQEDLSKWKQMMVLVFPSSLSIAGFPETKTGGELQNSKVGSHFGGWRPGFQVRNEGWFPF